MLNRKSLFVALLPASIIACGGGGGTIVPAGPHTHYVADNIYVPTNNNEAREDGLDLNGDGTVDNQLGMVLSALASTAGFDIQGTINKSVAGRHDHPARRRPDDGLHERVCRRHAGAARRQREPRRV